MRWLIFLLALSVAPLARAQEEAPPGPFAFGMSIETARAALPNAVWTMRELSGGTVHFASAPILIGGRAFQVGLEFQGGALANIRYGHAAVVADAASCAMLSFETVRALELAGAFVGERTSSEPTTRPVLMYTTGGSVLRSYTEDAEGETRTFANRRGPIYAEVLGAFAMREMPDVTNAPLVPGCLVMVEFSDDRRAPVTPVDPPTPEALEAAERVEGGIYIEQPGGEDYARLYPPAALRDGVEGRVTLDCLVTETGYLRCALGEETPVGAGFGDAALQLSRIFRLAPAQQDGAPTAGRRARRTIVFRVG